jgi:4'-phosphopantetheinyl transferase
MPLIFKNQPETDCHLMVWEIVESLDFFKEKLGKKNYQIVEFQQISHPHKQLEWLASRFLAKLLAESLHISYLGLEKDEHNKPFLHESDHHLSLSHTRSHVAAGIHLHKAIGIDLENISPRLHIIKHKFLTENERLNANDELEKLCIYWSAKESLYKLYGKRGVHFQQELQVLPFHVSDKVLFANISIQEYQKDCTIYPFRIGDDYLTVAV